MKVKAKRVVLMAAGMLSLRLAVIARAQESGSSAVPGVSARSVRQGCGAESSQSPEQAARAAPGAARLHSPGRRVAWEIPYSEGIAIRFTGSRNRTWWMQISHFRPTLISLTVQPDGFVALKGAGTLYVEGLTFPR